MKYNFDEIIDRKNTCCVKYDAVKKIWGRDDLLPMWVADMDFRTPDFIMNALRNRLEHEVMGYTIENPEWRSAIKNWIKKQQNWEIEENWILFIPGIVRGIGFALQVFTEVGDKVLVMNPVYHPFFLVSEANERKVIYHKLLLKDGQYQIDFEKLDEDLNDVKVFILSNPHNPGGRVWTPEELQKIAELAKKHGTMVISDEIHGDLTLPPYHHTPFASVSEDAAQNCITFGAPSKAFNTPGIVSSYAIVPNVKIRTKFNKYLSASELNEGNMFAELVTVAAYKNGAEWLEQVKQYILNNVDFVEQYLKTNIPQIVAIRPQASYLIFLDCHGLNMTHEQVVDLFVDKAHLALNEGRTFGTEGDQFMRFNVAAPLSVIEQALNQLKEAVDGFLHKQ